jgi:hypothetical protein
MFKVFTRFNFLFIFFKFYVKIINFLSKLQYCDPESVSVLKPRLLVFNTVGNPKEDLTLLNFKFEKSPLKVRFGPMDHCPEADHWPASGPYF